MKSILIVFLTILIAVGFAAFAWIEKLDTTASIIVLIFIIAWLIAFGYLNNLKAMIGVLLSGAATFFAGKKMLLTIDFEAPLLTSFYWSTIGYLLLSLVLLALTIVLLVVASKKPANLVD